MRSLSGGEKEMKIICIALCAVLLCFLLCGCFDNSHYYNYDYDSMVRYLNNCESSNISDYFFDHYSLSDIIDMYGQDAIMDYVAGMGWTADWIAEHYGEDDFRAGYSFGYEYGYDIGYGNGFNNGMDYEEK